MRRGFLLIELLIAIGLFAAVMLTMLQLVSFSGRNIRRDVDEARLMSEMTYALDMVKLYCSGATKLSDKSAFPPSGGTREDLYFRRERNVYSMTPSDVSDDIWYRLYRNGKNDVVLRNTETGAEEVMVEAMFAPRIIFEHEAGTEPNVFSVLISGEVGLTGQKRKISRLSGVRLWYAEVVQ